MKLSFVVVTSLVAATAQGVENEFRRAMETTAASRRRLGIDRLRFLVEQGVTGIKGIPDTISELSPDPDQVQGLFLETRQGDTCDFCGARGSCGRSQNLGNSYSVTVAGEPNSVWFATCRAAEINPSDCLYAPNNQVPNVVDASTELTDAYVSCSSDCCNYIYERFRDDSAPEFSSSGCTSAQCRMIERFCFAGETTFTCPVGTVMVIFGSNVSTIRTNDDGGILVGASDDCSGSRSSATCTGEFSTITASADDCSCVTCDSVGTASWGNCNVPVDENWIAEGFCGNLDKDEFCAPSIDTPVSDPVDDSVSDPVDDSVSDPVDDSDRNTTVTDPLSGNNDDDDSGNTGIIVGIVVGLVVLVVAAIAVFFCMKRKKASQSDNPLSKPSQSLGPSSSGGYTQNSYGYPSAAPPQQAQSVYGNYGNYAPQQAPSAPVAVPYQPYKAAAPDATEEPTDASDNITPIVTAAAATPEKTNKKKNKYSPPTNQQQQQDGADEGNDETYFVDL